MPGEREKLRRGHPAGEAGHGREVARMVAFLAGGAASYSTGGVFDVTGGMLGR